MSLTVYTGTIASGKTLDCIFNATRWLDVLEKKGLFIHNRKDTRDSKNIVSSNCSSYNGISWRFDVQSVDFLSEVVNIDDYNVICADECQFFEDLEPIIVQWLEMGKFIFCSGLEEDWRGETFGQIKRLRKYSREYFVKCAKCYFCTQEMKERGVSNLYLIPDACKNGKISGSKTEVVEVGGKEIYRPLCLQHHEELMLTYV